MDRLRCDWTLVLTFEEGMAGDIICTSNDSTVILDNVCRGSAGTKQLFLFYSFMNVILNDQLCRKMYCSHISLPIISRTDMLEATYSNASLPPVTYCRCAVLCLYCQPTNVE